MIRDVAHIREEVFSLADTCPDIVAPSHVVDGYSRKISDDSGKWEEITVARCKSVDLVVNPATVGNFLESEDDKKGKSDMEFSDLTIDSLKTGRPDLVTAIMESAKPSGDSESAYSKLLDAEKAKSAEFKENSIRRMKKLTGSKRSALIAKV